MYLFLNFRLQFRILFPSADHFCWCYFFFLLLIQLWIFKCLSLIICLWRGLGFYKVPIDILVRIDHLSKPICGNILTIKSWRHCIISQKAFRTKCGWIFSFGKKINCTILISFVLYYHFICMYRRCTISCYNCVIVFQQYFALRIRRM